MLEYREAQRSMTGSHDSHDSHDWSILALREQPFWLLYNVLNTGRCTEGREGPQVAVMWRKAPRKPVVQHLSAVCLLGDLKRVSEILLFPSVN